MNEIVDTGVFETLTCQYNLLDRTNEKAMEYAAKKGLGIVVMGPLGGGNIVAGGDKILVNPKAARRRRGARLNLCWK